MFSNRSKFSLPQNEVSTFITTLNINKSFPKISFKTSDIYIYYGFIHVYLCQHMTFELTHVISSYVVQRKYIPKWALYGICYTVDIYTSHFNKNSPQGCNVKERIIYWGLVILRVARWGGGFFSVSHPTSRASLLRWAEQQNESAQSEANKKLDTLRIQWIRSVTPVGRSA